MVLLIDNYDSFSYNVVQLIGQIRPDIKVIRNDEKTIAQILQMNPQAIILSPGPGKPTDAGICIDVIKELGAKFAIFGICLGHQAICEAFGGKVSYAKQLMHGKSSEIIVDNQSTLFKGLPSHISVARYHSLAGIRETLPKDLLITAETADGEIMAVQHKTHKIFGVQFHPESILTPDGEIIVRNFFANIKQEQF